MNASRLIAEVLPHLSTLGNFSYILVLLSAFIESLAILGSIFPGGTIVTIAGILAGRGYFHIADIIWAAAIGALLGDSLSFYLGTKGTGLFREENKLLKLAHLEKGKSYFAEHGDKSVFLGRFVPLLRAIVPFIAGLTKMDFKKFLIWNLVSVILWAAVHALSGYFFGNILDKLGLWSTAIGVLIVFGGIFISILWSFAKKSKKIFIISEVFFKNLKLKIEEISFIKKFKIKNPALYQKFINRFHTNKFSGLPLTLIVLIFVFVLVSVGSLGEGVYGHEAITGFDTTFTNFLFKHRDQRVSEFFLLITQFGGVSFTLSIFPILLGVFYYLKKKSYILPFVLTVLGTEVTVYLTKILIARPRPPADVAYYLEDSLSFPSGHASISMALYGFIAYILLKEVSKWKIRARIIFIILLFISVIGASRIYLGVHFLSDVLGGFLVGLLWLIVGISFHEITAERSKNRLT